METPIQSNGYYKYIIQIGWLRLKNIEIAVLAQDILSKTETDAKYLMNLLYKDFELTSSLPHLCPIVVELEEDSGDDLGDQLKRIELINPN